VHHRNSCVPWISLLFRHKHCDDQWQPSCYSRFITKTEEHEYVRRIIVPFLLCLIFFFLPLQIFIIGENSGIGIQGAVYRYQVSDYGASLIPLPREAMFIINGIYTGKTALSIIAWIAGTVLLSCTTIFSLIYSQEGRPNMRRLISYGILGSCAFYLMSCITQYGILFSGPAGISVPIGILGIIFWTIVLNRYQEIFSSI
jgi:hypothetical protein